MKNYLFVYGTLRKDYDLKLKDKVKDDLQYVGQGKIGAALYDIGKYPGAIKSGKGNEVVGEVFEINDPERVFRILDKYEGISGEGKDTEFIRKRGQVRLRGGKKNLNAWIYWYNFDPKGKTRIKQKDYLNYLKNKSTRQG
jgi:gamma-glutamylcyclotransferase (GGCT)/AIG2-like uncharacterized protein YtfP